VNGLHHPPKAAGKGGTDMSNDIDAVRADQHNFRDKTEDEVKAVPATTNADDAVEAITAHINKYDEPEEDEART